jgi:hypothetical protein
MCWLVSFRASPRDPNVDKLPSWQDAPQLWQPALPNTPHTPASASTPQTASAFCTAWAVASGVSASSIVSNAPTPTNRGQAGTSTVSPCQSILDTSDIVNYNELQVHSLPAMLFEANPEKWETIDGTDIRVSAGSIHCQ